MADQKNFYSPSFEHIDLKKQKRQTARVRTNTPAKYQFGKDPIRQECLLMDIGSGGIAIQAKTLFYKGDKLTIFLNEASLTVEGTVHRVSGKITVITFDQLPERERNIIQKFIDNYYYKDKK